MSSLLKVESVTQFATTAVCNFVLKKANVKAALPCSLLGPAVQTASVYHKTIQKTSDVYSPSPSHSSSLSPAEEAVAGTLGAYAGYQVLKRGVSADRFMGVSGVVGSSTVAGMAILGTKVATELADTVKQTHSLGGLLNQFATTALCNNEALGMRSGIPLPRIPFDRTRGHPLLCGVLSPAVQVAGNYVYHKTIQKTSDVPLSFSSSSSSLTPLEEAGAGIAGAGITSEALKGITSIIGSLAFRDYGLKAYAACMGISPDRAEDPFRMNIWHPMRAATTFTPLMRAGMAVVGTQVATNLADIVKRAYSSQASSGTELDRRPKAQDFS